MDKCNDGTSVDSCWWDQNFNGLHVKRSEHKVCTQTQVSRITRLSQTYNKWTIRGENDLSLQTSCSLISNQYMWRLQNINLLLQSHQNFFLSPLAVVDLKSFSLIPKLHIFSAQVWVHQINIMVGFMLINWLHFLIDFLFLISHPHVSNSFSSLV